LAIQRSLGHTCYHIGQIVQVARIHAGDKWETLTIPRGGSAQFNQVKVNHVEVNGDRASVTGAVPSIKKNATFQLQRVNGKWLVSSTGG